MKNILAEHWKLIVGVVILLIPTAALLILTGIKLGCWWKLLPYTAVVVTCGAVLVWGLNLIHDWFMEQ